MFNSIKFNVPLFNSSNIPESWGVISLLSHVDSDAEIALNSYLN